MMMRLSIRGALVALMLTCAGNGSPLDAQAPGATPAAPPATTKPVEPPAAPPATAKPATPSAGTAKPLPAPATVKPAGPVIPVQAQLPEDYVIGPDDILVIVFWREKDLSTEVAVRPDGRISIPLLQDVDAAGLTPVQLRDKLNKEAQRYVEDPNATVVVKEINSRRVFITGLVSKAGPYRLGGPTTVVQLIAMAGGLMEYADQENITIIRVEKGEQLNFRFNYKDIAQRKNLKQNILLKPNDTIVVP
jgi:polysaccharide biosynthesis/export protein